MKSWGSNQNNRSIEERGSGEGVVEEIHKDSLVNP